MKKLPDLAYSAIYSLARAEITQLIITIKKNSLLHELGEILNSPEYELSISKTLRKWQDVTLDNETKHELNELIKEVASLKAKKLLSLKSKT